MTREMARTQPPLPPTVRLIALVGSTGAVLLIVDWYALHVIPDFGPMLANFARSVVGAEVVAHCEDVAYRAQDRVNLWLSRGAKPKAYWSVPSPQTSTVLSGPENPAPCKAAPSKAAPCEDAPSTRVPDAASAVVPMHSGALQTVDAPLHSVAHAFAPPDIGPLYAEQAAPGDGVWVTVRKDSPWAYKTLIHPDAERPYAELFVAALDLRALEVHIEPGTEEPLSVTDASQQLARSGRVPSTDLDVLFAAFNGGFKTQHGQFGMRSHGVTLVPPKRRSCTIARYPDGTLRVATWTALPDRETIDWFRQTPGCMVESGVRHPSLANGKSWGATLDGETVIRRSALGLSRDGRTLYLGISNATHAEALARGMQHVGADSVAQLDVNYSFPRVLFYADAANRKAITPLAEGFVFVAGQYVTVPSSRDFFYVTRKRSQS